MENMPFTQEPLGETPTVETIIESAINTGDAEVVMNALRNLEG